MRLPPITQRTGLLGMIAGVLLLASLGGRSATIGAPNATRPFDLVGSYGPILTQGPGPGPGCYHYFTSQYHCPDTTMVVARDDSLIITVIDSRRTRRTYQIPRGVDAIFLTPDAIERFLIAYYSKTVSADSLEKIRQYVRNKLRQR